MSVAAARYALFQSAVTWRASWPFARRPAPRKAMRCRRHTQACPPPAPFHCESPARARCSSPWARRSSKAIGSLEDCARGPRGLVGRPHAAMLGVWPVAQLLREDDP
eukprot:5007401-Alexandrium_andersonii.AAC.1